jgi:SAM-dependent methyltransferase
MYLSLASATDGRVLELACGTGRIAVPLAVAGHDVTGVDIEVAMLARAARSWRQHRARARPGSRTRTARAGGDLTLVKADLTTLSLRRRFDLVILGFNSLLLLDRTAQVKAVRAMARHLSANGRVVIDVWLPAAADLAAYNGRWRTDWTRVDEENGRLVTKRSRATHDPVADTAMVETTFTAKSSSGQAEATITRVDNIQFVDGDQLQVLLDDAGLQPQMVASDYSMAELAPQADRMIVVAARKPALKPARQPAPNPPRTCVRKQSRAATRPRKSG